jgi:hypothetical protein
LLNKRKNEIDLGFKIIENSDMEFPPQIDELYIKLINLSKTRKSLYQDWLDLIQEQENLNNKAELLEMAATKKGYYDFTNQQINLNNK